MANEKGYMDGIYVKNGKFGLKVSINVDVFIAELKKDRNDKGYVNLDISERKQVSDSGISHSVKLDTWQPQHGKQPINSPAPSQSGFLDQPNDIDTDLF